MGRCTLRELLFWRKHLEVGMEILEQLFRLFIKFRPIPHEFSTVVTQTGVIFDLNTVEQCPVGFITVYRLNLALDTEQSNIIARITRTKREIGSYVTRASTLISWASTSSFMRVLISCENILLLSGKPIVFCFGLKYATGLLSA